MRFLIVWCLNFHKFEIIKQDTITMDKIQTFKPTMHQFENFEKMVEMIESNNPHKTFGIVKVSNNEVVANTYFFNYWKKL